MKIWPSVSSFAFPRASHVPFSDYTADCTDGPKNCVLGEKSALSSFAGIRVKPCIHQGPSGFAASGGICLRTSVVFANETLYQLSYTPTNLWPPETCVAR
jgi:hypothetical protein